MVDPTGAPVRRVLTAPALTVQRGGFLAPAEPTWAGDQHIQALALELDVLLGSATTGVEHVTAGRRPLEEPRPLVPIFSGGGPGWL